MKNQWRLLCDTIWPEPENRLLSMDHLGVYKKTNYLLSYKNQEVKDVIRNNKFHYHKKSAQDLAEVVDGMFKKYGNLVIIPVPSSNAQLRRRGFDHLTNILQFSDYNRCVRSDILRKKVDTKTQSHVDKKTRLLQQRGAFTCNVEAAKKLTGTVVLFDDVVTTQSTMSAARTSIAPHLSSNVQLVCLAIAH